MTMIVQSTNSEDYEYIDHLTILSILKRMLDATLPSLDFSISSVEFMHSLEAIIE